MFFCLNYCNWVYVVCTFCMVACKGAAAIVSACVSGFYCRTPYPAHSASGLALLQVVNYLACKNSLVRWLAHISLIIVGYICKHCVSLIFFPSQQEACMKLPNRQTAVDTNARVRHNYTVHPNSWSKLCRGNNRFHQFAVPVLLCTAVLHKRP